MGDYGLHSLRIRFFFKSFYLCFIILGPFHCLVEERGGNPIRRELTVAVEYLNSSKKKWFQGVDLWERDKTLRLQPI